MAISFLAPHKTAISRLTPSVPMRQLKEKKLLVGRVLDYGSGRGDDAKIFKCEKFDPFWSPIIPKGLFDTITCNYVLNVVSEPKGREILGRIKSKLKKDGSAYVTVRSDVQKNTRTQRDVHLEGPGIERMEGIEGCRMYLVRIV